MKVILFSIQLYWFSLFFLPFKIFKEIDSTLKVFLWSGVNLNSHKAKVAWDEIYVLKDEEGLGLMSSKEWNKEAISKHLWNLVQPNSSTIWVSWVKRNLL